MEHEFLTAWARFRQTLGPNILTGDELPKRLTIPHASWNDFVKDRYFNSFDRKLLHLSLIPQPFIGNINSAPVVILTLNPGLSAVDYYGEYFVDEYRRALLSNLCLDRKKGPFPNLFLDPTFSWHSGFSYWYGRLEKVMAKFVCETKLPRIEALSFCSRSIAFLDLVPYHSSQFGNDPVVLELHSVQLAKKFAQEVLLPSAQASEKLLVVARRPREWDLPEGPAVIVYKGSESRAAHLTPDSRGGEAILAHLLRAWKKERA